jgi:peptidoglycan/LPS O-acetylase OafA/YrhL
LLRVNGIQLFTESRCPEYEEQEHAFSYRIARLFRPCRFPYSFWRGRVRSLGDWANKFVDLGKYGVISFFVLSALTLAISMERTRKFSYAHYLKRRFARIFPMYCVAIIIFWWMGVMITRQAESRVKSTVFVKR